MDLSVVGRMRNSSTNNLSSREFLTMTAAPAECKAGKWIPYFTCLAGNNFVDTATHSGIKEEPNGTRQDEDSILSGVDLDRTAPKFFPRIPKSRESVAKEIVGLLKIN